MKPAALPDVIRITYDFRALNAGDLVFLLHDVWSGKHLLPEQASLLYTEKAVPASIPCPR